jgi:hypothetical protein
MTEDPETIDASKAATATQPAIDDSAAVKPLVMFGAKNDELVCLDDTCVPAGAIE